MKFEQLKNVFEGRFVDIQKNSVDNDYLLDSIEMIMLNTSYIAEQIYNCRVRAYNPPYNALLELFNSLMLEDYNINEKPTTKQLDKLFKIYDMDYKTFLNPLTEYVTQERLNEKANS